MTGASAPLCDSRLLPFVAPAQRSHGKFFPRGPFTSVILAQLAVESAYGERLSGRNNFFGIKATRAQVAVGAATKVWTKEFVGGHYVAEELYFADYASPEECFDAHGALLCSPWYSHCIAATSPEAYAAALYQDHYATAPNYASVLVAVMRRNNLFQFDQGHSPAEGVGR